MQDRKKVQKMKKPEKLSLNDEINREAEKIEKEVMETEGLDDIKVSEDMETSLFNKIQEYEYDKRMQKTVRRRKKRKYVIVALAAVLVLAFGSMMTGVGSKSYWKVLWERATGEETIDYVDVENMDSQETEDLDEIGVYRELNKTFGDFVARMLYKPKGMILTRYTLDDEQRIAYLFYRYNDEVIRYTMYMNDTDSSFGQKDLDKLSDEYEIQNGDTTIKVEEYDVEDSEDKRYIAEFEYMDIHYQLMGVMEKEEFDEILKNLKFL